MLGMMNCPSDSVEFYCEQPADSKIARDLPEEAAMFKKDGKQKSSITYTPDGRKLIDGKPQEQTGAPNMLWNGLFARTLTKQIAEGDEGNGDEQEDGGEPTVQQKQPVKIVEPVTVGSAKEEPVQGDSRQEK